MKRKPICALLLLAALVLTSCASPQIPAGAPAGETAPSQTAAEKTETPDKADAEPFVPLQNGNMQKNIPSGDFVYWEGKVLFTDADRGCVRSFDPKTGSVNPFCKDATCDHLSKTCVADGADTNLESYAGEIYAKTYNGGGSVLRLEDGRFVPVVEGGVSHFFHADGDLYVATLDASLVVFRGGRGKPETVLEEYTGYWESVSGGYLYYEYEGMNRIRLADDDPVPEKVVSCDGTCISDGTHLYYVKDGETPGDEGFFLYRAEMDGSGEELLVDLPVLPASWNFDDSYFYFRLYRDEDMTGDGSCDLYRISRTSPGEPEKFAVLPEPAYQIFIVPETDLLFVRTVKKAAGYRSAGVYTVSKEDGTVTLLERRDG